MRKQVKLDSEARERVVVVTRSLSRRIRWLWPLGLVLVAGKVFGAPGLIGVSWLWVLTPFWIVPALIFSIFAAPLAFLGIVFAVAAAMDGVIWLKRKWRQRNGR